MFFRTFTLKDVNEHYMENDSVVQITVRNLELSKVFPISLLQDTSKPLICKYASCGYSSHQQPFIKSLPCIHPILKITLLNKNKKQKTSLTVCI